MRGPESDSWPYSKVQVLGQASAKFGNSPCTMSMPLTLLQAGCNTECWKHHASIKGQGDVVGKLKVFWLASKVS